MGIGRFDLRGIIGVRFYDSLFFGFSVLYFFIRKIYLYFNKIFVLNLLSCNSEFEVCNFMVYVTLMWSIFCGCF